MKKAAQRLLAFCVLGASGQAMSQPFTCGGHFLGSDTQAQLAQAIIEDGGRAAGV
ncbi:hypothetical protein [Pseudomonas frederiksbergensis]|uniref:hypothetical protein n=1 Tax=Pseudomonas frederiksbergensis TaxID=104087 RepID=UPI003D1A8B9D